MISVNLISYKGQSCVVPSHLTLDIVGGFCNARCAMCVIHKMKSPSIMTDETLHVVVEKFAPIKEHLSFVSLHYSGEPLLDKRLAYKVNYLKSNGFKGVGFASNSELLTERRAEELINAGLDTIICSIDGVSKATHEKIRVGTNFETVVRNVRNCIRMRNKMRGNLKVMVRFIRQEFNNHEWDVFKEYWEREISPEYGDKILRYDVHDAGGLLEIKPVADTNEAKLPGKIVSCKEIYSRMIILSDGRINQCCGDTNGLFDGTGILGNIYDGDPIDLFNSERFLYFRKMIEMGKIMELEMCRNCGIPQSDVNRIGI